MNRYLALDAFRGLTIALMILVNTPGSWGFVYSPLLHANWHGLTPTDLVFPFFMFIVGSAMFFAFKKHDFTLTPAIAFKIIKRGILIFLIGLFLNAYPFSIAVDDWRVMGVLQRIGIAYLFAAFIVLSVKRRGVLLISLSILVFYSLLLMSVSGGAFTLENNLVRTIDLAVLSAAHMYGGMGIAFDPEGLLSTLPSVVSVLFGFEITRYISDIPCKKTSMKKLLQLGVLAVIIGMTCGMFVPINKALWTMPYVIITTGIASLTLAFFVYLIDIKKIGRPVEPLFVYGTNPLFIYVISWLWVASYGLFSLSGVPLHQWMFQGLAAVMPEKLASFTFALSHVVLFWWFSKCLYQRKIFIKI